MTRRLALALCLAAPVAAQEDRPPVTLPTPDQVKVARRLGELYYNEGQHKPAVEQWDLVLRAVPGDTAARYYRAFSHFHLLAPEPAEADCDTVLADRPGWVPALTLRGSVRMLRGRWAGAVADFDAARAQAPQVKIESLREQAEALRAAEARVPLGAPAPGFKPPAPEAPRPKLIGLDDQVVDLPTAAQGGALVLVFHPEPLLMGPTAAPVVMSHLSSLREHRADLTARGATVLAVSRSTPAENRALAEEKGLDYPLLSDTDGQLAAAYGVTDLMHIHADLGHGTLLAVMVVDKTGVLRAREVFVNPGRFLDFEAFGASLSAITGVQPPAQAPPAGAAAAGSGNAATGGGGRPR